MTSDTRPAAFRNRRPTLLFVACAAGMSASQLGSWLSPQILGDVLQTDHLSASQGGLLLAAEFWTTSVVSILLANIVLRLSYRQLALAGAAAAILFQWLSAVATDFDTLLMCRVIVGAGEGTMLMSVSAFGAEFEQPERVFGWMNLCGVVVAAIAMALLPFAVAQFDAHQQHPLFVFRYAAVLLVLLGPALLWSSPRQVPRPNRLETREHTHLSHRILGWMGCGLIPLATGPIFTFADELGAKAGLGTHEIQLLLTLGVLFSLVGTLYSGLVGLRWGTFLPIAIACTVGLVSALWLSGGGALGFRVATLVALLCAYMVFPLLLGILAELDSSGRSSATGAGIFNGAFATGPAVAGVLVDHFGILTIGIFCAGAYLTIILVAARLRVPPDQAAASSLDSGTRVR